MQLVPEVFSNSRGLEVAHVRPQRHLALQMPDLLERIQQIDQFAEPFRTAYR